MEANNTKVTIVQSSLSNVVADAYVLPFLPYHECPTGVRLEVASAGALGIRDLVSQRLAARKFSYGHVSCIDSQGGKSRKLIAIVCRHPQQDTEQIKSAFRTGLWRVLFYSKKYGIKRIAMPVICYGEGLEIMDFSNIVKEILETKGLEHGIEEIFIADSDKDIVFKLYHAFE